MSVGAGLRLPWSLFRRLMYLDDYNVVTKDHGTTGGAIVLDPNDGNVHVLTPNAETTFTFGTWPTEGTATIDLVLTDVGATVLNFPAIAWPNDDTPPTLATTGSNVLRFTHYNGVVYGELAGGIVGGIAGPGSSTDNAIARWNGTGGYTLQDSGATVDDNGRVAATGYDGKVVTVGNLGAAWAPDVEDGSYWTGTVDQNVSIAVPANAAPDSGGTFRLTNLAAFVATWAAGYEWAGGTAATGTAAGVDLLVWATLDGTTFDIAMAVEDTQ